MADEQSGAERERQVIVQAKAGGRLATLGAYFRLSGPGWLQSAITLGGGSLAGSLYLGVLAGLALLWLQPMAMILGIIMLSAIGYVTLSTGERPFDAINRHVNPVLGWGWILATLMANCVWSLPQFSIATAAIKQNLLTGPAGTEAMSGVGGDMIICVCVTAICVVVVWFYNSRGVWVKVFNAIIKIMVAGIVLSFIGVVVTMSFGGVLDWGKVFGGLIPDFNLLASPAATLKPHIAAVGAEFQDFWSGRIVSQQRDVMIAAAATAVGINMTFLMPYSMLKRGWDREFRGLAIFDLSTGLFIPFILATGCVVIASASRFHATPAEGFLGERNDKGELVVPDKTLAGRYKKIAEARVSREVGKEAFAAMSAEEKARRVGSLPEADKRMAAMLVNRDSGHLAASLEPLTGRVVADYVFGLGVIGMTISTIIILMLINGFVICEMFGVESKGLPYRIGTLMPCIGMLAPILWTGKAKMWLVMPTSIINFTVLPIAYVAFYLMMNQKSLMGENMPTGGRRCLWNVLMAVAAGFAALGSIWSLWLKLKVWGLVIAAGFTLLVVIVHFIRAGKRRAV